MSAFVILPIVVSFISSPVGTNPYIKEIGYYAKTCPVEEPKRIYLETAEERDMITKLGRSVNVEINNTGHGVTTSYYYNVSMRQGKVLEARQIRNDVDSFAYMVGQLELCASDECFWPANQGTISLGYIRTLNKNYRDGSLFSFDRNLGFTLICGGSNSMFNDYVDSESSYSLDFSDYFGSFVATGSLNHDDHKKAQFNLHNNHLVDPMDSTQTIDMTHLITVIDGVSSETWVHNLDPDTFNALISWAGDLQDAVGADDNEFTSFESMLFSSSSRCSYEDFVADIDGLAIGEILKGTSSIEEAIRDYYHLIEVDPGNYRYSTFIGTLGYEYDHDYDNLVSGFEKRVFDMLALELHDDGSVTNNDSHLYKYLILKKNGLPSMKYRYRIGKSFVDYVLGKAHMQEEIILDESKVL